MSEPTPAVAAAGNAELTKEELIAKLNHLSETQNQLINVLNGLQRKAEDPFLQFKTPDPIKNLPCFSGNKKETYAWVEDAENTLNLFHAYKDTPMYTQIVRAIKNKIVGGAKEILIAAGNPSDWDAIKDVLLNSYGDRRDLPSHILSLFYARQGKRTLSEYYNKIKSIDTAIKTTVASMEDYKFATSEINKLISLMTLTRFIDGLGEQLSMYVRSYRPESLEEAYNITLQYSNASYRQKLDRQPDNPIANTSKWDSNKQQTFNKQHKPNNQYKSTSGKFKDTRQPPDDDVTMKTHQSRMLVNSHEGQEPKIENQLETEKEKSSQLDSEDDDLFDDELNFQVGYGLNAPP